MEIEIHASDVYLSCIPDPMLVIDTNGIAVYANRAFSELTGIPADSVPNLPLEALNISEKYKNLYWKNHLSMGPGDIVRQQFMQKRSKKRYRHFDVRLVAVECPIEHDRVVCFVSIINDITDIVDKNKQVKVVEGELQKAAETLKQLLYKSSHDLRSPIASIKGVVSLANLLEPTPEMQKYLEMILDCSHKMDRMLTDMRKIYTMYLGNFVYEKIDFDRLLNKVLKKVNHKDCKIEVKIELTRDHLHCRYLLEKIVEHLMDNACKYKNPENEANHTVNISITDCVHSMRIEISDNGQGIHDDMKNKIFDMFFRGEYDSRSNGMGLYIVKTAVDKLYGKIHVESKIGKGSTFTVILP